MIRQFEYSNLSTAELVRAARRDAEEAAAATTVAALINTLADRLEKLDWERGNVRR